MSDKSIGFKKAVLVLGGRGFIGRHIVRALRERGHEVTIGSRFSNDAENILRVPFHEDRNNGAFGDLFSGFDVVINAVGILRQRWGETYQCIHHEFVERAAKECAKREIRFIHVSALGLTNPVRSRFLSTKRAAEKAIINAGGDFFIVRPSLIDGDGGYGAKWFRRVAKWPVHILPSNAQGLLAPIHVLDLAEAIVTLCVRSVHVNNERIIELGGDKLMTTFEYLTLLKGHPPLWRIRVPAWLARGFAHCMDVCHLTPFSFGHYELLKFDNKPMFNRLPELIARATKTLGECEASMVWEERYAV